MDTDSHSKTTPLATFLNQPLIIVMVGLPARGKSFIATKVSRYLNWIGINCKAFHLGHYRRLRTTDYKDANFFRLDNVNAMSIRRQALMDALHDIQKWLNEGGSAAILDGTNATKKRREIIRECIVNRMDCELIFLESIVTDPKILEYNINQVKNSSPDYEDISYEESQEEDIRKDFQRRQNIFEKSYEPLSKECESNCSYIKYYDSGKSIFVHNVSGAVQNKIVYFLLNLRITPKTLYFTRHGETFFNVKGLIGGNSELTANGVEYAKMLGHFMNEQKIPDLVVWTSFLKRAIETAAYVKASSLKKFEQLNELKSGICEGLTYPEVKKKYPLEYAARAKDKFHYRFPNAESYQDATKRIEPLLMELERETNILIISHQATLRCFMGYFQNIPNEEIPFIDFPLHTLYKLSPYAWGCHVECIRMPVEAVNTYVPKGQE